MSDDNPFPDLSGTLDTAWEALNRGVADRTAPFRLPILATAGPRGPEARIVVLRRADRAAQTLTIHTDSASAKVGDVRADPRATLLFWDAEQLFQLRCRVSVGVAPGSSGEWQAIPEPSRAAYGGDPLPGASVSAPEAVTRSPDPARFAVLTARIREIETLQLGDPHRRALFTAESARWIVP